MLKFVAFQRGQFDQYDVAGQGLACLNDKEGVYFTVAYNVSTRDVVLLGISLRTLQLLDEVKLPFLESLFVGVGQYCNYDPGSWSRDLVCLRPAA